jgi:hypothetical protein
LSFSSGEAEDVIEKAMGTKDWRAIEREKLAYKTGWPLMLLLQSHSSVMLRLSPR